MSVAREDHVPEPVSHPEEIRADYELRVGNLITVQASARITPAGVISAGIAAAAIIVAVGFLVSPGGRRKSRQEPNGSALRQIEQR